MAQWIAHQTSNLGVVSSSLITDVRNFFLERIILNRLVNDNIYHKIHKNQTGFIPLLGTNINILKLQDVINKLRSIDNNKINSNRSTKYLLFIDFKAAYDSVDHRILFKKLEKMRVREELINAIKLLYSSAKMKTNYNSKIINVN